MPLPYLFTPDRSVIVNSPSTSASLIPTTPPTLTLCIGTGSSAWLWETLPRLIWMINSVLIFCYPLRMVIMMFPGTLLCLFTLCAAWFTSVQSSPWNWMTLALSSMVRSSVVMFSSEPVGSVLSWSGQGLFLTCGWTICMGQSTMRQTRWLWTVTHWRCGTNLLSPLTCEFFSLFSLHNPLISFSVVIWLHQPDALTLSLYTYVVFYIVHCSLCSVILWISYATC